MAKLKNVKKIKEIERMIAHIFAREGYHNASMRDIAKELDLDKSSLYHYIESKEAILFKLMNDAIDEALAVLEEICARDLPPEDKLKEVLSSYARYYAGEQDRGILLVNEMHSLNEGSRPILIRKQRRYVSLMKSILKEVADQKRMKEVDHSIAMFAFFGMVHYTPKWYRKDGPVGLEELADTLVEIFTTGVIR